MQAAQQTERRLLLKLISAPVLDQYMRFRNQTNRSLAAEVKRSPALIAHLRRGARAYCEPAVAVAIEKALNAPPGSLFLPEVHGALPHARRSRTA